MERLKQLNRHGPGALVRGNSQLEGQHMSHPLITMVVGQMLFLASAALSQTTAPGGSPAAPAPGAPATGSGLGGFWWIILVVLAIAAIWYFMKGRSRV